MKINTEVAALLLFASISVASTLVYKDCGSAAKLKNVVVSQCGQGVKICPLKRNTNISFEVDFVADQLVSKATTVVHGIIEHVPLPFPGVNPDGCKDCGLVCPFKSGESMAYKTSIFVKPDYPKVKLIIKWELQDQKSKDIFCIELPAEIVD